jgi:hypothetical protein
MPDRLSKLLARLLIGTTLLLPFSAQAQTEGLYRVELLVFSHAGGSTAEQWDATPDLGYPESTRALTPATPLDPLQPTPFATLPSTQHELDGKAGEMQRSGRYRILFHEAWIQPMMGQSAALPIVLDRSGDGGQWPALQGTIKLYMSSDINLDTNLWLNTQGEYLHSAWRMPAPPVGPPSGASLSAVTETKDRTYPYQHAVPLRQTSRIRSGAVNYVDHPMLGVIVKVMPLSGAGPVAPTLPETTTVPKPGLKTNPPT